MEQGHAGVDEREVALARHGRGLAGGIVAGEREHAAEPGGPGEVGVAEDVAGAVHPRALAVPDGENAILQRVLEQRKLLRAPDGGGGEILVDRGVEADAGFREERLGAPEFLVDAAERRAAVAGDVARGREPGFGVAPALLEAEPDQRLRPGHEGAALDQPILVVERDADVRHASPPQMAACRERLVAGVRPDNRDSRWGGRRWEQKEAAPFAA